MIHLTRILCPTDYSPTSDNAVRYAVEFARKVGAHVRIVDIGKKSLEGEILDHSVVERPNTSVTVPSLS